MAYFYDEIFSLMTTRLMEKTVYHMEKQKIYSGKREAESLHFSLPPELERNLHSNLGWGKTAVDTLLHDVAFDAFKGDVLGFTRLLYDHGGYPVITACQKNAMVGACAFASVLPGEDGNPIFSAYSGSEATGLWDARKGLVAGLVKNSYDASGGVVDYLLFLPGAVLRVDAGGRPLAMVKMPTERMLLVPFIHDQDVATAPFGRSRFNAAFVNALDSALRTLKLIEVGHDLRMAFRNVLLGDGISPGDLGSSDVSADVTKLLAIFNENPSGSMSIQQVAAPDTAELQNQMALLATNGASAVGMDPTAFGYQPSNGSYSAEAIEAMRRPYDAMVDASREAFGRAIRELAVTAMALVTGQYLPEWEAIVPVFQGTVPVSQIGVVADGIGKLTAAVPGVDFSELVTRQIAGKRLLDEALQVELPSFTLAQQQAAAYATLSSSTVGEF